MRICVDLDGVISKLKKAGEEYSELEPMENAVNKLRQLKQNGHYIIIQTARHMKTCESNVGLVNARIAKVTLDWLAKHKVPYDEIYFGKPFADLYIDDNALRFDNWNNINIKDLITSHEKKNRAVDEQKKDVDNKALKNR